MAEQRSAAEGGRVGYVVAPGATVCGVGSTDGGQGAEGDVGRRPEVRAFELSCHSDRLRS